MRNLNELQKKSLYGTHMPILARIMDITEGPVLELGMGIYSTPLLDMMCAVKKRMLISYDNDPVWFKENEKWASDYHKVIFVDENGWEQIMIDYAYGAPHWTVVLVDHKPAKQRIKEIKRLANKADYILIHDSEPESDRFFKYSWIYKLFKYRYDYTKCRPNTTVLSNFVDLSFLQEGGK